MTLTSSGSDRVYAGLADVWATDAVLAYGPLARHLVAHAGPDLSGRRTLDAGAGSGVAADALRRAGARVVAVDLEPDMARYAGARGPAVVGDLTALPVRDAAVELAVAAFVLNHLERPVAGLTELRRVTRAGGTVLVAVFAPTRSVTKAAVDVVAERYGYVEPGWYAQMQRRTAALGTVAGMTGALRSAGFDRFEVTTERVDLGLRDPDLVVRYRTGLAQLRPFVAGLHPERRQAFLSDAADAVARADEVLAPPVLEVVARC